MKRAIVITVASFGIGFAASWILSHWIPDGPAGLPGPTIYMDALGHSFAWSPEEQTEIMDRGRMGYQCMVKRLQKHDISDAVLAADLALLAKFYNIYYDTPEVSHILLRFLRSDRLETRRAVATALLYDFDTATDQSVMDEIIALDTTSDEYLSKVIKRFKMKHGYLPRTEENWKETCMHRLVGTGVLVQAVSAGVFRAEGGRD